MMTNINQYGGAFDFLAEEPDLYSVADFEKRYVIQSAQFTSQEYSGN